MEETISKSSEFIPIIIEGLFGLTTIMLVVFSLISNDVIKKTSGFSLINLKRYNIKFLLLPIYLVFFVSILMMIFNQLNKGWFLLVSTMFILVVVTIQTYYMLQPLYKQNKCKLAIIKAKTKSFEKKIKNSKSNSNIEEILINEEIEIFNLLSFDNFENKYILYDDKKSLYKLYWNIIVKYMKKDNEDINIRFIKIGLNIFGLDFIDISDEFGFPEKLMLEIFLNKNSTDFNIKLQKKNLELIHTLFELSRNGMPIEDRYSDDQIIAFITQTIENEKAINHVVDYIFDTQKWSFKDSSFIKVLLNLFSSYYNKYKLFLEEEKRKRFEIIIIAFKSKKELVEEVTEFDKRFNFIVKTLKED